MVDKGTPETIREEDGRQTQFAQAEFARTQVAQFHLAQSLITHNPVASARDLGISELSPTEWRISDRMMADGDPAALVGFIQRVDDAFEVTDFGRPRERSYFSSFDRARASLTVRPTPTGTALR